MAPEDARPKEAQLTPKLLDRLREAIRLRHYGRRTEEAYVGWVRRYILFHHKRHPAEMAEREVTAFLSHLAQERQVSSSTQNQAIAGASWVGGCSGRIMSICAWPAGTSLEPKSWQLRSGMSLSNRIRTTNTSRAIWSRLSSQPVRSMCCSRSTSMPTMPTIVTAYRPHPDEWAPDLKTRRTQS